jgi:hypothetical protein
MVFGIDDAIMLGTAAVGVGLQLFGSNEEGKAAKRQAEIAKRENDKQKKRIKEKVIPLMKEQGKLQAAATEESKKAEALRARQMELDAMRTRREIVRSAVTARSLAIANAFQSGAENSSGLFGGLAQITAEGNRQGLAVNQNLEIGRGIFASNLAMSNLISQANKLNTKENIQRTKLGQMTNNAQTKIAAAGVNDGSSYATLGTSLINNSETISKLGMSLFG